ncbi:MAG: NmrA family NAD(P)-binding protein [Dehalococcoidia bacterium]
MKVLILGATGNLGRMTATKLAELHPQIQLRLTSHRDEGRASLREAFPQAEVAAADWYDESTLRTAVSGVDKVLMVTPDFYTDETVVTPNLIRAIKAAGEVSQLLRFIAIPPDFTINDLTPAQLATRCGAAMHVVAKPLLDASGLPVTYVNAACWIMFNLPWFMAEGVKASRRLLMPSAADAARQWVSEEDLAECFAKILADDAARHVGREYWVIGQQRYTFAQVAALIGEVIGEKVIYVDDDSGVKRAMGEAYPTLMTYFTHETQAYAGVTATRTIEELLGRPQVSLRQYIAQHSDLLQ